MRTNKNVFNIPRNKLDTFEYQEGKISGACAVDAEEIKKCPYLETQAKYIDWVAGWCCAFIRT